MCQTLHRYNILQLCACSRSLGASFELLIVTISARASLLQCSDLPIENALHGEKLGQNSRGNGRQILTSEETFLLFRPRFLCKNCDGVS